MNPFLYQDNNKRYHTLDYFYRNKFNTKISKISLNAGFTCPNIDGKVGTGGCIYCSNLGSGDFAGNKNDDLITQFNSIKKIIDKKWKNTKYIGYFQAHTNTYAPLEILKEKYESILNIENVIGLSIATRPDSIEDDVLDYLEELNKKTYLTIELGLQTIHKKTSIFINRCHTLECLEKCVKKLRESNINVVIHIINGLPYETKEMMIDTIKYLNNLDIQGIKIHMLHILENTKLGKIYKEKPFKVLTKEEYIDIVCDQLEYLREDIVINRITGDPNQDDLIEPSWLDKKLCILNDIDKELEKRQTYQGFRLNQNNLLYQILDPILRKKDYILDLTNQNHLFNKYTDSNHILNKIDDNLIGKITTIILNDPKEIDKYLPYLHNRGFILILTNEKTNQQQYNKYNTTFYEFENKFYIIKIDKNKTKYKV